MTKWKDQFPKENIYYQTDNGILYKGDCLGIMKEFPKESIDLILTDPPYGTTACKWDSVIPFEPMWERLKKIRKDNTPIVLFGSEPFSSYLRMSNIKEYKYDWIWDKVRPSGFQIAKYKPMLKTENISIFGKGKINYYPIMTKRIKSIKGRCRKSSDSNPLAYNDGKERIYNTKYPNNLLEYVKDNIKRCHPTQKPVALLEYLIKTYTNEDDLILDFTCGSGTTLVAAEKLNRRYIGIELEEKYCEITKKRLIKTIKSKGFGLYGK